MTAERVEIYRRVPPPGDNFPVDIEPLLIDNYIPLEDEDKWNVQRLQRHLFGAPLGMRAEYLCGWLARKYGRRFRKHPTGKRWLT